MTKELNIKITNADYYCLSEYCVNHDKQIHMIFPDILKEFFKNHEEEFKEIKRNEYLREISRCEEAIKRAKEKIEELEQKGKPEV